MMTKVMMKKSPQAVTKMMMMTTAMTMMMIWSCLENMRNWKRRGSKKSM